MGGFSRFPYGFALARVPPLLRRRQIESIVIGKVKYFSSLGLHAVDVVGGNVSTFLLLLLLSENSVRGSEEFAQPRGEMTSSPCEWRARSLCGQNGAMPHAASAASDQL